MHLLLDPKYLKHNIPLSLLPNSLKKPSHIPTLKFLLDFVINCPQP